jgi:hypothetical protein
MLISSKKYSNWNPNQICKIGINSVAQQKQNRARTILKQLLLIEKPTITTTMINFFQTEHAIDCFIEFLIRNNPENELESIMYSFKVTFLLSKPSPCFEIVIAKNLEKIVVNLFQNCFKKTSKCHYQHLTEVLKSFHEIFGEKYYRIILDEKLIDMMLGSCAFENEGYFLFLFMFVFASASCQKMDEELKEELLFQLFYECDIFNEIIPVICQKNEQVSTEASDFLFRCLNQPTLQTQFINSFTPPSMNMLLETISEESVPYEIRHSCSKIVLEICKLL